MKTKITSVFQYLKEHLFLQSLLVNAVYYYALYRFVGIYFETNDDMGMAQIAYNVYGSPTSNLVFINPFIGKLIHVLLAVIPSLPWYSLLQILFVYVSFCVIVYFLIKKNYNLGWLISVILLLTFGYDFYTRLQFTKTAGAAAIAGILLFSDALFIQKISVQKTEQIQNTPHYYIELAAAFVLLLFSSAYRWDMFLLTTALMSFLFAYTFFQCKDKKARLYTGIFFALTCLLCIGVISLRNQYYIAHPDWQYYKEFNQLRADFVDHEIPDYEENLPTYEALNINDGDLELFRHWNFADPEIVNANSLKKIISLKDGTAIDGAFFHRFFGWFPSAFLNYTWLRGFFAVFLLVLFVDRKRSSLSFLFYAALFTVINCYFAYIDRFLTNRIDICLLFAIILSITAIVLQTDMDNLAFSGNYVFIISAIVFIMLFPEIRAEHYDFREKLEEQKDAAVLYDQISGDKSNLYLFSISGTLEQPINLKYSATDVMEENSASNISLLGGWLTYSPIFMNIWKNYGINNPFKDAINRPDIIWVAESDQMDQYVSYIRRHYDENVFAAQIRQLNGYPMYLLSNTNELDLPISDSTNFNAGAISTMGIRYSDNSLDSYGNIYLPGQSSYNGRLWLSVTDDTGTHYYPFIQTNDSTKETDENGLYSYYKLSLSDISTDGASFSLIYGYNGKYYQLDPGLYTITYDPEGMEE